MRVLKKKDIIAEIQPSVGYSPEVIQKVVDSFWDEIGDAVRNLRDLSINIPKIGELRIVKRKLDFVEEYLVKKLEEVGPGNLREYYENKLVQVRKLKVQRDEEYQKREEVRQRRSEYEKTKESMGIQDENPGSSVV